MAPEEAEQILMDCGSLEVVMNIKERERGGGGKKQSGYNVPAHFLYIQRSHPMHS